MYIIKVLKRRDAASIIVAIVLGFTLIELLPVLTQDLSGYLSGITDTPTLDWRASIAQPLIAGFLKVVVLEAILRVVIYVRPYFVRREVKKAKK